MSFIKDTENSDGSQIWVQAQKNRHNSKMEVTVSVEANHTQFMFYMDKFTTIKLIEMLSEGVAYVTKP